MVVSELIVIFFFCQAEDGIRDLVRSRGLGDVYKRQARDRSIREYLVYRLSNQWRDRQDRQLVAAALAWNCLLYTSDAADERSSVDLGGRRIIKKKKKDKTSGEARVSKHSTRARRRL